MYKVKDIKLHPRGERLIYWAEIHMPVLELIRKEFEEKKPLKDIVISACMHVTKETAVLMRTLKAGGAEIALAASNPLSTQDEVAAALAKEGIHVYAWRGQSKEEYYECIENVLSYNPDFTMDDGADLVTTLHVKKMPQLNKVKGGTEETTTGVVRLRAMAREKVLKYPIIAVNDANTKRMFDNYYGTGQSTLHGILNAASMLIAGKTVVVCGYGFCGKGIAIKAKGLGANVIVTEVDPIKALQAVMDGFQVMPLKEAACKGDVFVTATGNINVIRKEHMLRMKDGAVLANAGHFNVEISLKDLEEISREKRKVNEYVEEYILRNGRKIYLLGEGRLINLVAAQGHPPEVMDLSFANQALSIQYLAENYSKLKPKVYNVPRKVDEKVARLKLKCMGIRIDKLTREQRKYLRTWTMGT